MILNCLVQYLFEEGIKASGALPWPTHCVFILQSVGQDKHFIEHFLHTKPQEGFILGTPGKRYHTIHLSLLAAPTYHLPLLTAFVLAFNFSNSTCLATTCLWISNLPASSVAICWLFLGLCLIAWICKSVCCTNHEITGLLLSYIVLMTPNCHCHGKKETEKFQI